MAAWGDREMRHAASQTDRDKAVEGDATERTRLPPSETRERGTEALRETEGERKPKQRALLASCE